MRMHIATDDGEKLRIRNRLFCFLEAAVYHPPEAVNIHTPGYAHTAMVSFTDHRSANLPSFLLVAAMQSISYDVYVPPLASIVGKIHDGACNSFQGYSHSDWVMQRWSFCEAIDVAVGMSEE